MVIPLGAGPLDGGLEREPIPEVVLQYHLKWWYMLLFLFTCLAALQIAAMSIFMAILMGATTFVVWFMVRDNCKEMTQPCLVLFGVFCLMQCVFDTIILCSLIGGRTEQKTVRTSYTEHKAVYTTTVTRHPFYDPSQGLVYNCQSAARIASPLVMLLASILCFYSQRAFENNMFGDDAPFGASRGGSSTYGTGGYAGYGGAAVGGGGGAGHQQGSRNPSRLVGGGGGGGAQRPQGFAPFEGSGQRLGGTP